jgi:hypothetical protein
MTLIQVACLVAYALGVVVLLIGCDRGFRSLVNRGMLVMILSALAWVVCVLQKI